MHSHRMRAHTSKPVNEVKEKLLSVELKITTNTHENLRALRKHECRCENES